MNSLPRAKQHGFTIVELLIVIVIIAILATITIVAYNGIQNRANDVAVQTDLDNAIKQVHLFNVINGHFPKSDSELKSLKLTAATGSYNPAVNNFAICSNSEEFGIAAVSKSGKAVFESTSKAFQAFPVSWNQTMAMTCPNVLTDASVVTAWGYSANSWHPPYVN